MKFHRPMGAWMLAALFFGVPSACLFNAEVPDGPCASDATVCDDGDICTTDICGDDGFCTYAPLDPIPDDGNPCTVASCSDNVITHADVGDGTPCGLDDKLTCQGGSCACTMKAECGVDTTCQTFSCDAGACAFDNKVEGTFVDALELHDCRQEVCDGNGGVSNVADLVDFPPDAMAGDCQKAGCSADGKPGVFADLMDFPIDAVAGDCTVKGCSMDGKLIDIPTPGDAPPDDGKPCTTEGCTPEGVLIDYVPVANGTLCGPAAECKAAGSAYEETTAQECLAGECVDPTTTTCGLYKCNGTVCHQTCATIADCVGGSFCDGGLCKPQAGLGLPCSMDGQCGSGQCADGVCCNADCGGLCEQCDAPGAVGVCTNILTGTDPDNECADPQVCNGSGACKTPLGETCAADSACINGQCEDGYCCNSDCAGACRSCDQTGAIGTCTNLPAGETAPGCDTNQACNGAGTCKKAAGQPCAGNSDCLSGFCPVESGQDVCCDTACNTTCTSCQAAKTGGTDGVCGDVLIATDPDNDCTGMCNMMNGKGCCDGAGVCVPP